MARKKSKAVNKNIENNRQQADPALQNVIRKEIFAVVMFMAAVFILISLQKFRGAAGDAQLIGIVGTYLTRFMQAMFGSAAAFAACGLILWAVHIAYYRRYWSVKMAGLALFTVTILVYISTFEIPLGIDPWEAAQKGLGGGYIGGGLAYICMRLVGGVGTSIVLILSGLVAVVMMLEKSLSELGLALVGASRFMKDKLGAVLFYEIEVPETASVKNPKLESSLDQEINEAEPDLLSVHAPLEFVDVPVRTREEEKPVVSEPKLSPPPRNQLQKYTKPNLEMLSMLETDRTIDKKHIKDSIAVLEDTFTSFGITVKVNQVSCGPAVTRYELTPAPGVKVSRIISLTDDLQLNLAAPGIRIEAPIPGKSAIGIEVPRTKVGSVGLRSILASAAFKKLNSPLAFALGEDIAGNPVVAKLSDMPHLLIAGSTGSGKSVCLNCIIMSLLFNADPEELKLVFIDPKMVELTIYNGIPHLLTPVVTDPKKASLVLRWMTTEMEKRYKLFADQGVRDISRYNQAAPPLPFIVIVIDELADLMMVAPVEVEDSICRLAQMARAAGIHLIVATQRPSVDVVTGIIKANIPSRIAFAVSSQTDSRTILDIGGAEKLLGKGDMLFAPVGAVKPYRVQGAFVSDRDIETAVDFIKGQMLVVADEGQFNAIEDTLDSMDYGQGDDLFWDAVRVVVESQKASVSFLQRRLRVGYARAARLMDLMEERGIVSAIDNNKKREILIDEMQLEKLYSNHKLC